MEIDDIRMPLTSADVTAERLEKLKELFPEAFTEGKVDFDRLRQALGDLVETGRERYGLTWAGKADAIRAIQTPSVGTLIPVPKDSVNFDTTENLIIEGENLEVLKLLQKSYHGKVKMIYIDPPYNTGNEFIYPDDYKEPLKQYLRLTGQVSEEGVRLTTNTETSGRYHSNWLSMMYPRLFLARNLLRDDGVIFVSIDYHESANLRLLMDEIFGEENYIAEVVWQKRTSPDSRAVLGIAHDSILVYARSFDNAKATFKKLPLSEERRADYTNPDNDPRGDWVSVDLTGQTGHATKDQFYEITTPSGRRYAPPKGRCWALAESTFLRLKEEGRIWFGANGDARPRLKKYLSETAGVSPWSWWSNKDVGHNQEATKELNGLLGASDVFDNPKPTRLIKRMLQLVTEPSKGDLVLDFFAGSGTTGHAVFSLNQEDGGNRRFILAQLPEPTDEESPARAAGYYTIADICKDRIRRVISKMQTETSSQLLPENDELDLGFKVFKLTPSNFKIWEGEKAPQNAEELAEQLTLYADHVFESRSQRDILYELILKSGLPLTAKIEKKSVDGKTVYSIADGLLLICLEDEVTAELLRQMMDLKPQQIICLDRAFRGNDQLKTNTVLEMKQRKITFHTV